MPLQIEILSKAEVEAIWKNRARAENFADYLNFLNARDIGDSFRLTVEKGDKNADSARSIRHNFVEAAKERVKATRDADGRIVIKDGLATPLLVDGKPVPDPVLLKWKTDSHLEKKITKNKDGKSVETEIEVIDKLTALLSASATDAKPRAPRPETEIVAVPNATDAQKAEKKLTLADGRVAKMRKDGTWHAPKIAVVAAQEHMNGVAGTTNTPAETLAPVTA